MKLIVQTILFSLILLSCVSKEVEQTELTLNTDKILDDEYQYWSSDTVLSIIKNGNMDYELVFNLQEERTEDLNFFVSDIYRLDQYSYAGNNSEIEYFIPSDWGNLCFSANGIFLSKGNLEETQKIHFKLEYNKNSETLEARERQLPQEYYHFTRRHLFNYFEVIVKSKSARCYDTGNNDILFYNQSDSLQFRSLNNILVWSDDLDNDKIEETYIIDYAVCKNRLKIYKVKTVSNTK